MYPSSITSYILVELFYQIIGPFSLLIQVKFCNLEIIGKSLKTWFQNQFDIRLILFF